jgi:hypothetical protein
MKKTALLFLAPLALLVSCKEETDFDDDPHIPLVNPFVGVWQVSGGGLREFRTDGTGGDADSLTGPFGDDFSFFIYAGQDTQTTPEEGTLVTVQCGADAASAVIAKYGFHVDNNAVTLTGGKSPLTLTRRSGTPEALNVSNSLIGEWIADWNSEHGLTWSLKYRSDGTVKTLHHEARHQFENGYTMRGDVLVIFGQWRFSFTPLAADITLHSGSSITVTEIQSSEQQVSPAVWLYTKTEAAPWL